MVSSRSLPLLIVSETVHFLFLKKVLTFGEGEDVKSASELGFSVFCNFLSFWGLLSFS